MAHLVIDRSKISPEWDAATKLLYLWLCEEAAFSPHEWRGVTVGAGQYLTTLRELAEVFNCSYETIRSRLKKISEFQSVNVQTIKTKGGKYGVNSLTLITLNRTTSNKSADLTADLTATGQPTKSNLNSYDDYQVDSLTADLTADLTLSRNKGITEIKGTETSSSSPNTRAHAYTHEGQAEADEICRELVGTIRADQISQYNIQSKCGITSYAATEFVRDFANDVLMNGGLETGERGRKLVMHFTNWLQMELRRKARAAAEDKRNKQISSNGDPRQAARETAEAMRRDFFAKYGGAQPHSGIGAPTDLLPDPRGVR